MGARTIRPALDVFLFQMMEVCHVGLAAECGIYMLQLPSSVLAAPFLRIGETAPGSGLSSPGSPDMT